jgi:hypothetical protein
MYVSRPVPIARAKPKTITKVLGIWEPGARNGAKNEISQVRNMPIAKIELY